MSSFGRILRVGSAARDLCRFAVSSARVAKNERTPQQVQALCAAARAGAILIVEAELPRPDRDAGSRILVQLLRSMVEMGMRVYFLPANVDVDAHYTDRLAKIGVEALSAPQSQEDWRRLQTLAGKLDFVWLCRPLVAVRFLSFFRRHSTAQVLYYAVDLHFVREARRYRLSGRWLHLLRSWLFRSIEHSVIARSDAVLCLSHEELSILSARFPLSKLRWVPPHVARLEDNCDDAAANESNPGLIFVGNFRHAPNEDALRWFLQSVWPRVRNSLAGVQFHIVGAAPPEWLRKIQSVEIQLHDGVNDRQLTALYRRSRVALAPLRFGAGVKGKVLEAMEQGVPVVSTSIGLEGLPETSSLPAPCDDAESFADSIVRLVTNHRWADEVAHQQRDYLNKHFSPSEVKEQLTRALTGQSLPQLASRPRTPHSLAAASLPHSK